MKSAFCFASHLNRPLFAAERIPQQLIVMTRMRRHCSSSQKLAPSRPLPRGRCTHRSEEHTSELQSRQYLVCRLLLEKKNNLIQVPATVTVSTALISKSSFDVWLFLSVT